MSDDVMLDEYPDNNQRAGVCHTIWNDRSDDKMSKSKMKMEIKEVSESGSFEGLLSPYNNIDHGGDVVEPGAYTKTLKDHGDVVPLLWQHDHRMPIGTLELIDKRDGLYCKGQLAMDLAAAKEAYICLKQKIIKGLSIGFETMKDEIQNGVRHLKEIRLYEGSIVTFPMNELAAVTAVKSGRGKKGDFIEELSEIQTLDSFYQIQAALRYALNSILWESMSKEDKISMAETIVNQFAEAFSAFFPNYLDVLENMYGSSEEWSSNIDQETKQKIVEGFNKKFASLHQAGAGSTTPLDEADKAEPDNVHSKKVSDLITGISERIKHF